MSRTASRMEALAVLRQHRDVHRAAEKRQEAQNRPQEAFLHRVRAKTLQEAIDALEGRRAPLGVDE